MLLGVQRMELLTRHLHLRRLARRASRSTDGYWSVPNVAPEHFLERNQPAARQLALALGHMRLAAIWRLQSHGIVAVRDWTKRSVSTMENASR
ncbi:hypothetical protein AL527_09645 [Pseudomonas fulva]|nr:hypothetical protein AL527_09645 [Pseudomonas fulva]